MLWVKQEEGPGPSPPFLSPVPPQGGPGTSTVPSIPAAQAAGIGASPVQPLADSPGRLNCPGHVWGDPDKEVRGNPQGLGVQRRDRGSVNPAPTIAPGLFRRPLPPTVTSR